MATKQYKLSARVSTDSPGAVRLVLEGLVKKGTVKAGDGKGEFLVEALMSGQSAKELNRSLLSALRRVEKKTRLRAEWTCGGTTERFFDYVTRGTSKAID